MIEFDYAEAVQMLKDNLGEEKAQELINEFKELVQEAIEKSWVALDEKDYEQFGLYCHTIKSNVAILSGPELEALCLEIEIMLHNKEFEKIAKIEPKYRKLSKEFHTKIKNS